MKNILSIIAEYWKGITAVVGIVSFISIASVRVDRKKVREDDLQKEVKEISTSVKDLKDTFVNTDLRLERIERSMYDLNNQMLDQRMEQGAMKKTLIESISKNPGISKEDYNYLMNILLDIKKNNSGTGYIEIPLRPSMIPYNSTLSLKK
jgi:hypothetical protein